MATPDDSVVEYYYEDLEVSAPGPGLSRRPADFSSNGAQTQKSQPVVVCFSQSPDLAAALLATAEKCTGPLPVEKSGRVDVEGVHEGRRQVEARIGRALDHVEGGTARPYNCEQERRRGCRGYAPSPGETIRAGRRASRGERIGRHTGPLPGLQAQRVLHRGHRRSDPTHDQGGKV